MTKYVIAALLTLTGLLGWGLYAQIGANSVLAARNKTLTEAQNRAVEREKLDRKVLVARQAKIASQARELAQAQEVLSEALQRNNDWRDTNVPDEVQNALHGPSTGL